MTFSFSFLYFPHKMYRPCTSKSCTANHPSFEDRVRRMLECDEELDDYDEMDNDSSLVDDSDTDLDL